MGSVIIKTTNDRLLNLNYADPEVIKQLLSNYGTVAKLARKGDTVASAVIIDLENALGVSIEELIRDKKRGLRIRNKSVLTEAQFISVVYVLLFGYQQIEVAFILGVSKQDVSANISRGLDRMCKYLEGRNEKAEKEKGRYGG